MYHPVNITEKARGHYNFLQHFVESGRAQLRGVIDKKFISCSFSRHAKTHASMVLVIWLNENVHIHVRFLAMPKLMQTWFWSFGLTKTFFIFRPIRIFG
jgi:hypothetical protein